MPISYHYVNRIVAVFRSANPSLAFQEFLKLETASSILLIFATILALLSSNIAPFSGWYHHFLELEIGFHFGTFELEKHVSHWINDGLMAIFFLVVSLELKREIMDGQLSNPAQVLLPGFAAIGGMVIPALFYLIFNYGDAETMKGWAIPAATDIAFSLGVLALLGSRIPLSLKLFLMALAIIDDLGAILIIAFFYSGGEHGLNYDAMLWAGGIVGLLAFYNFIGVRRLFIYIITGIVLWYFVLKSGVHATLAGVALAFFIPLKTPKYKESPLRYLEHMLHPWVAFAIMPIFAFANAGIAFEGMSLSTLADPVPLGIIAGLFLGKQVGVILFSWVLIKTGYATLPKDCNWLDLYGAALLCGIGFTMSLFIGSLAFVGNTDLMNEVRLGVLAGSFLSAAVGYAVLVNNSSRKQVA
ncbi:Na+/H+ antiporter NhaA [Candidatus Albibeggiatoa sp. nov. NOAA]|uniref:Na+/H+ antiporter NhaA n=1 Tax=Candidatus Albibeggiatoa sp. nov. NOAA TaxID=3162724 RepID=UPI0032F6F38C|nr:Na+/H+ antiporter NhaA [Thiotrichaceae bacterium]